MGRGRLCMCINWGAFGSLVERRLGLFVFSWSYMGDTNSAFFFDAWPNIKGSWQCITAGHPICIKESIKKFSETPRTKCLKTGLCAFPRDLFQ